MQEQLFQINNTPFYFDDGHGDYNRSYERSYDDFDYADYSTDHRDNNFRNFEKKRKPNIFENIAHYTCTFAFFVVSLQSIR